MRMRKARDPTGTLPGMRRPSGPLARIAVASAALAVVIGILGMHGLATSGPTAMAHDPADPVARCMTADGVADRADPKMPEHDGGVHALAVCIWVLVAVGIVAIVALLASERRKVSESIRFGDRSSTVALAGRGPPSTPPLSLVGVLLR